MILFPAIDVLDNRAVRLLKGRRNEVTDYGLPVDNALRWRSEGAQYLHLVDLNGAFDDAKVNEKSLKAVIGALDIPVQIGGGIKSLDRVKFYMDEVGAARVIIGSAAVLNPDIVSKACALYGDKIAVGIDERRGRVAIKGWVEESDITPTELAVRMRDMGVKYVIYTDIERDGALCGVNAEATAALQNASGMRVIASGGMAGAEDISSLVEKGVYGAILGRSIYEGTIDLKEAIKNAGGNLC